MGMRGWMKKGVFLSLFVLVMMSCSVLGGGNLPPEVTVNEEPTDEVAVNAPPDAEDPAPTEVVPTPTEESTPQPTPPKPYQYTILEQKLVVEENGMTSTGVRCGSVLMMAMGLAKNDTNKLLVGPDIYIQAYDHEELIERFRVGQSHSTYIVPGGEMVFKTDRPKCADFNSLTRKGYQIEELNFEIGLYAKEKPTYDESVPYSDLEIVSVVNKPREDGSSFEVTVKNVGSEPAYSYLHYLYYDDEGVLVDGWYALVSPLMESVIGPGEEVTQKLFSSFKVADYKLFVLGHSKTD